MVVSLAVVGESKNVGSHKAQFITELEEKGDTILEIPHCPMASVSS